MSKPILALVGAVIGGAVGFFLCGWLARQGFYTVLLPGALIGFGALIGKFRSILGPILLAIVAPVLVYFTEWHYFPFTRDRSLGYFVQNLADLKPLTHIMAVLGMAIAFWLPFRNRSGG